MGRADIVPCGLRAVVKWLHLQRGGRDRCSRAVMSPMKGAGWHCPAAAGRTAGRPTVSCGFVGFAFVSVSHWCP